MFELRKIYVVNLKTGPPKKCLIQVNLQFDIFLKFHPRWKLSIVCNSAQMAHKQNCYKFKPGQQIRQNVATGTKSLLF